MVQKWMAGRFGGHPTNTVETKRRRSWKEKNAREREREENEVFLHVKKA